MHISHYSPNPQKCQKQNLSSVLWKKFKKWRTYLGVLEWIASGKRSMPSSDSATDRRNLRMMRSQQIWIQKFRHELWLPRGFYKVKNQWLVVVLCPPQVKGMAPKRHPQVDDSLLLVSLFPACTKYLVLI